MGPCLVFASYIPPSFLKLSSWDKVPSMEKNSKIATMADDHVQPWKIPPIVQELAAGVQEPPSRYVVRDQDRPAAAAAAAMPEPAMPEPIPIVDLSRLSAADDGGEVAKLQSAVQNWGLFLVKVFLLLFSG